MLRRIDLTASLGAADGLTAVELRDALPRATGSAHAADRAVAPILGAVKERGSAAVLEFCEQFDHVRPRSLRVPAAVIEAAEATLDPDLRAALVESIRRARLGHEAQLPTERITEIVPGGTVTQRWVPVERVGLYVPGGLAFYPSSVVMNVVPAQVAGVSDIVVSSPPQVAGDGWPEATVLAACALLGVTEVYAAGGAQAVALLAYGSADYEVGGAAGEAGGSGVGSAADSGGYDAVPGACAVQPVDVITGPGNVYVTAAKRALRGTVGIDSEAGPTEIAIIADASANPRFVAADLISQAEHDPNAAGVLITDSPTLADAVDGLLPAMVAATRHGERVREALTGPQSGIVLVASIGDAIRVADAYGAEHLEVQTRNAAADAGRIRNAGAIFVGPFSPVSLGDYCAGSNHVLPTSGGARYGSALGTTTFLKSVQVVEYSEDALRGAAPTVAALTAAENLPAHGEAVAMRLKDGAAA